MKRTGFILLTGLLLALAGYACVYLLCTRAQRAVEQKAGMPLAWIQTEFQLTDAQFAHVRELHEAYQPKCMEMCRRIDAKNAELQTLLAATNTVTPQIKQALAESARLRAECESAMLAHFYEVAQAMPPEQGKRYLACMQSATLMPGQMLPQAAPASHQTP